MSERFNGTSIAESHIGAEAAESLDILQLDVSVAAEAPADNVTTTIQVKDACGQNLKESVRLSWKLKDTEMLDALVAAWTSSPSTGTVVSTDDQPALLVDTDENGLAVIDTADVATGTAETLYAEIEVVNRPSRKHVAALVFT